MKINDMVTCRALHKFFFTTEDTESTEFFSW